MLFNYTFEEKERDLGPLNFCNTDKEVITQLLKWKKNLEDEIKKLTLENQKLKVKEKQIRIEELEQRFEEVELQEEHDLYSYPVGFRNNNLLNIEFLFEFPDGYKLPITWIVYLLK